LGGNNAVLETKNIFSVIKSPVFRLQILIDNEHCLPKIQNIPEVSTMSSKDREQDSSHHRPLALVGIAATGVLTGAFLGAVTNSINGWISPLYFQSILHWHDVDNIWRASIAQGIFEGLLFGLFMALVFTIVVGIVSKVRCSYRFGAAVLLFVAVAALICWAVGGLIAMALAMLSPDFYRHAFYGVPDDFNQMLRYAWVGGSIWGIQFGGFALTILGSFLFYARWKHRARNTV
jgi:hypothetical protein